MLSFINMECSACGSEYTLSVEELNVMVLFSCFECRQHNIYIAGHVLELDQQIMTEGTEEERRRHIVETVQLFACEFAGNVIKNVDRIINVNLEMDIPESGRSGKKRKKKKSSKVKEIPGVRLCPSVQRIDAPEISPQEVRDFLMIDLHLIDKQEFFNRYFGKDSE